MDTVIDIFDAHRGRTSPIFRVEKPRQVSIWCFNDLITGAAVSDYNTEIGFATFKNDKIAAHFCLAFPDAVIISDDDYHRCLLEAAAEDIEGLVNFVDGHKKQEANKGKRKVNGRLGVVNIADSVTIQHCMKDIENLNTFCAILIEKLSLNGGTK